MPEVIIEIATLRYAARNLEARGTDKVKIWIENKTLKIEVLKTGERAEITPTEK